MKRIVAVTLCFGLAGLITILSVKFAASQPRVTTTRQIQVIGAAGSGQTIGAWLVDLQTSTIIFCERTASGPQCHTTPLP